MTLAVNTHVEDDRRARTIGQQARGTLSKHRWIETRPAIR